MMQNSPRVYAPEDQMLPRFLIQTVLLLLAAIMTLVIFARLTERPPISTPPAAAVIAEAQIQLISNGGSGAVTVLASNGDTIADLTPEEGGFIAGVHRAILRERAKNRAAENAPLLLQAFENGRMAITDPATGWRADLMGFGAQNARAFARLLAQTENMERNSHGTIDTKN